MFRSLSTRTRLVEDGGRSESPALTFELSHSRAPAGPACRTPCCRPPSDSWSRKPPRAPACTRLGPRRPSGPASRCGGSVQIKHVLHIKNRVSGTVSAVSSSASCDTSARDGKLQIKVHHRAALKLKRLDSDVF